MAWAGAALGLSGCAGGGTSTVLGPTPASSVTPVGSAAPPNAVPASAGAKTASTRSLSGVHAWTSLAALPAAKPEALLASLSNRPADLLIVDLSAPAKAVAALQEHGRRRVLARLDVGEITTSDPNWQAAWADKSGTPASGAPSWLETAEAKTPDVHPVQFWDADWQKRVTASLDKLLDAGYDGVCVEDAGAYDHFLKDRSSAGTEMAAFIDALAAHARKRSPAFSVLVDGATGLPAALTDAQRKDFLAAIDGVLAHDVFFGGDKPTDNDLAPAADVLTALDAFQKADKTVFVTERLTDPDKIADFLARAKSKGYVPDAALTAPATPVAPATGTQVASR